jgi:hypothetical protein
MSILKPLAIAATLIATLAPAKAETDPDRPGRFPSGCNWSCPSYRDNEGNLIGVHKAPARPNPPSSAVTTKNEADGCHMLEVTSTKPMTDCAKLKATMKKLGDGIKDIQDCTLTGAMMWSANFLSPKDFTDGVTAALEGRKSNVDIAPPLSVRQTIMKGCIMIIKDWPESDADRVVKKIDWSR